ncbi:NAP1-related protein 2-like isoform X2 [Cucumis melo]|uniref:NAP1-related protein 2-like isoform X2 n=1 Tax=Cucumis melo TaxID=3656 RepID=A0ABM3KWT8_CUCME|nr:NAP1-related protein 2-like isoform X2 [Cucumis melo]
MGYSIIFSFNENPYFEDRKLEKTYTFFEDEAIKITGTTIKWKDGSGASNGVNGEKKGKKRPLTEDSFFSWFGETDQKDITELHDEVAEIIKEDLWPNPLKYFNNSPTRVNSSSCYHRRQLLPLTHRARASRGTLTLLTTGTLPARDVRKQVVQLPWMLMLQQHCANNPKVY